MSNEAKAFQWLMNCKDSQVENLSRAVDEESSNVFDEYILALDAMLALAED